VTALAHADAPQHGARGQVGLVCDGGDARRPGRAVPELQRRVCRLPPAAAAWAIGRSAKAQRHPTPVGTVREPDHAEEHGVRTARYTQLVAVHVRRKMMGHHRCGRSSVSTQPRLYRASSIARTLP
jgi:hypothetical protein